MLASLHKRKTLLIRLIINMHASISLLDLLINHDSILELPKCTKDCVKKISTAEKVKKNSL